MLLSESYAEEAHAEVLLPQEAVGILFQLAWLVLCEQQRQHRLQVDLMVVLFQ